MRKRRSWQNPGGVAVVVVCLIHLATADPDLTLPALAVALPEETGTRVDLTKGITCPDTDGDSTRVYLQSTSPGNPCGKCFAVWPIKKKKLTDEQQYRLVYNPSMGQLSAAVTSSYFLSIACTDDQDFSYGSIEVVLEANQAPTFDVPAVPYYRPDPVIAARNKRAGDVIFTVHAVDPEGDAVFYSMTAQPDSDLFEIGYADGNIYVAKDLRFLCETSVQFVVTATDVFHSPVSQVVIDQTFRGGNVKPTMRGAPRVKDVSEFTAVDSLVYTVTADDSTLYNIARFKLRAEPERGLEYYYLQTRGNRAQIYTRRDLDYEYEFLRSVTLYVDMMDGFCEAETFSMTMRITDENERPAIVPAELTRYVYEGNIVLDPGWEIVDPDEDEDIKWTTDSGSFYVDQNTGIVRSIREFDIDPNTDKKTRFVNAKVKDKRNIVAKSVLTLIIKDQNDNPPVFNKRLYEVTASNCTKTGALIDRMYANDRDSRAEGNSDLVFSGSPGKIVSVLSTGHITLMKKCTPGETEALEAYVTDRGTYPGPLSGVPATVQFTCNVCPEPNDNDGDNNGNTNSTDAFPNDADFGALNLGWVILAAVPALLLAAVLAFVIWRFCIPACKRWQRRRALLKKKRTVKSKSLQQRQPQKKKKKPDTPPSITLPPPPELPPPEGDPIFFGFWKETYVDRDQRHMPKRDVVPATVAEDKEVEEKEKEEEKIEKEERKMERQRVEQKYRDDLTKYYEEVQSIRNPPPPPPPPPKKKFCHIL